MSVDGFDIAVNSTENIKDYVTAENLSAVLRDLESHEGKFQAL